MSVHLISLYCRFGYESAEDSIETIDALAARHDKNLVAIAAVDARTGILKRLLAY